MEGFSARITMCSLGIRNYNDSGNNREYSHGRQGENCIGYIARGGGAVMCSPVIAETTMIAATTERTAMAIRQKTEVVIVEEVRDLASRGGKEVR